MPTELKESKIQDIHLELIRRVKFDSLNGPQIVLDLEKHRELWQAVFIDRPHNVEIKLRDLPENVWNVDTIYILSSGQDDKRLNLLAKSWQSDKIAWIENKKILSIWWD